MDQFVTTYRKDFLWPYVRTFGLKPDSGPVAADNELCVCQCRHDEGGTKMVGPNIYDQDTYQKLGPALPLMDPKLYPARVGPAPESDTQRFNQPNVFLEKLRLKYPFLYEILRTASPDDVIMRINRDRLRTTYQVDFCHLIEYPSAPYDELLRSAGFAGKPVCAEPVRLPGDPCRPNQKPMATTAPRRYFEPPSSGIGSNFATRTSSGGSWGAGEGKAGGGGGKFGGEKCGPAGLSGNLVGNTTEYQDAISKLGELIIQDRIHYRKFKKDND